MTDEELTELRKVEWMESRIPVLDALSTFHPGLRSDGTDPDPLLTTEIKRWPEARWYPIDGGGFRILVPKDGQPYDLKQFSVAKGAWDHSHCDNCRAQIPAMTLCWVTRHDPYVILCAACYAREIHRKPWWKVW